MLYLDNYLYIFFFHFCNIIYVLKEYETPPLYNFIFSIFLPLNDFLNLYIQHNYGLSKAQQGGGLSLVLLCLTTALTTYSAINQII